MDTKIMVLLLLGVSLLAFGCAGKKAETPTTMGPANESEAGGGAVESDGSMESNGTMDEADGPEANGSANASGDDLLGLADLFRVDTDKPLEGEGFDVKSVDSNES